MKITPELNIVGSDLIRICTQKKYYDILEESSTQYKVLSDLEEETWLNKELFVVCPDNLVLDSQTSIESIYNRLKQRDSDYHKVYKERMGIVVMTWPEEDYLRHKDESTTSQEGLPEGHSINTQEREKGV